jgi:hypothetical protein
VVEVIGFIDKLFGKSASSKREPDPAVQNPQATGKQPGTESISDATADYLRRQDIFLQSIGPHMRRGVDYLIANGDTDRAFVKSWDAELQTISAAERGQLLVDWAHWHVLRAQALTSKSIKEEHPKSLPLLGLRLQLPDSFLSGELFNCDIDFTENQAQRFLGFALEACDQSGNQFNLQRTKDVLSALRIALKSPDQFLASRIRSENYKMRWAEPLLKVLCPLEAATPALEKSAVKEVAAVYKSFRQVLLAFKRLQGIWVRVPGQIDSYWGHVDHQMFPFFGEISACVDAVELALHAGHDVDEYRRRLLTLRDITRINLKTLKMGGGEHRSLSEIMRSLPIGEKPRIRSLYWSIGVPESEKEVFDASGRPKVSLITTIESRWLSKFETQCKGLETIGQKQGLSKKLSELLPSETASVPTKSWIKKAASVLNRHDLLEILRDIAGQQPIDPKDVLYNPVRSVVDYDVAQLRAREFRAKVWAAHLCGTEAIEPLYVLAQGCYKKVPGIGPKNTRLGNSAAASLSLIAEGAGVPHLLRLQREVKYPNIKAFLEKCLAETAKREGPSVQDLKESATKDHGFS